MNGKFKGRGGVFMGIVVVRSPRCLRGLLRRIFKVKEGIHQNARTYSVNKVMSP